MWIQAIMFKMRNAKCFRFSKNEKTEKETHKAISGNRSIYLLPIFIDQSIQATI